MADQPNTYVTFVRNPKLKFIEARFCRYKNQAFQKHFHETYAIGLIEQGVCSFFHQDKTEWVSQGNIALINPGEVHACNPHPDSTWVYKMFYVETELIQKIAGELAPTDRGEPMFTDAIVNHPSIYQALLHLYTVMLASENTLEKDSWAYRVFAQLLLKHGNQAAPLALPEKTFPATQRAYEYLMDNIAENISLQQLSTVAGLSAYHFLRVFQQRYGLPPHTFQLQQRINLAKKMLAQGNSIVQVALELGFTDQSHFTKKFKPFVGATPRQYQLAIG